MTDVVVVGAGIVGASVAYHLARHGVSVTLIDQGSSAGAGVTAGSYAWIGNTGGDWPGGAEDLRGFILSDYRRLEAELPEVKMRRTGSLSWSDESTGHDEDVRLDEGQYWVGRQEIAALEPNLRTPPERAVHIPSDCGVDAKSVAEALVRSAREFGTQVVTDAAVTSLKVVNGHATGVLTADGFHAAETVVLAAGTGITQLCRPLGIDLPIAASPACLLRVAAPTGLVRTIVAGPDFEAREISDGQLLMTMPSASSRPESALRHLKSAFVGCDSARLLGYSISERPMPADGPIIGYVGHGTSVYVAVMHSAICLAPTVGRLVAHEIATGQRPDELLRCRP